MGPQIMWEMFNVLSLSEAIYFKLKDTEGGHLRAKRRSSCSSAAATVRNKLYMISFMSRLGPLN